MYRTTPISFLAESACHAPAPVMRIRINYQLLQYKDPDPGYGNSPYGSKSGSGKSLQYTDSRKKKSNFNFFLQNSTFQHKKKIVFMLIPNKRNKRNHKYLRNIKICKNAVIQY